MKQIIHFLFFSVSILLSNISIAQKANPVEWIVAGNLPGKNAGLAGAFVGVSDQYLWIGGGANFPDHLPWEGGIKQYHNLVYFFKRDAHDERKFIAMPKTTLLPASLAYGISVQTGNATICIGGENEKGHTAGVYRISVNQKDTSLVMEQLPDLPVALSNASGAYYDGRLFIAGGETDKGTCHYFFVMDTRDKDPKWKELSSLPMPVSHSVLVAQSNGKRTSLYLIGGRTKTNSGISHFYDNVYEYDLQHDRWKERHKMPFALSAHTSVPVNNNRILVAGGDKGETFRKVEQMLVAIKAEKDSVKKEQLVQSKNKLLRNHPGFNRNSLVYNAVSDQWETLAPMPIEARVTTTAVIWGEDIVIPSGEIRAGVRTPQLLSGRWIMK
ncbi:MAG: hypothetical protein V4450_16245 [Bacteroidota bacterium]